MKNVVCSILTLALGIGYLVETRELPISALSDGVGASGFPILIACGLIVLSIFLILQSAVALYFGRRTEPETPAERSEAWTDPARATIKAAGLAAIAVAFLILLPIVGYAIGLILLLWTVPLYQGRRFGIELVAVTFGGALALWLLFVLLADIPVPAGVFGTRL